MVESGRRGQARQAEAGGAGVGEGDEAAGAEAEQERQERGFEFSGARPFLLPTAKTAPDGGVIFSCRVVAVLWSCVALPARVFLSCCVVPRLVFCCREWCCIGVLLCVCRVFYVGVTFCVAASRVML